MRYRSKDESVRNYGGISNRSVQTFTSMHSSGFVNMTSLPGSTPVAAHAIVDDDPLLHPELQALRCAKDVL
ncbi:hypothetical protein FRC02_001130 [Tulasnella sp. 418]|nr:hypothetical protein FRC02_001130 [Tulasnella sp. 418]